MAALRTARESWPHEPRQEVSFDRWHLVFAHGPIAPFTGIEFCDGITRWPLHLEWCRLSRPEVEWMACPKMGQEFPVIDISKRVPSLLSINAVLVLLQDLAAAGEYEKVRTICYVAPLLPETMLAPNDCTYAIPLLLKQLADEIPEVQRAIDIYSGDM